MTTPPDPAPKAKLVANERAKLAATFLNSLGVALLAVGIAGPVAAVLYGTAGLGTSARGIALVAPVWIVSAAVLHGAGRIVLRGLEP